MQIQAPKALESLRPPLIACLLLVVFGWSSPASAADQDQADRIAVGDTAPEVALEASDATLYQSQALRGEKNLLLIFFRGTW